MNLKSEVHLKKLEDKKTKSQLHKNGEYQMDTTKRQILMKPYLFYYRSQHTVQN